MFIFGDLNKCLLQIHFFRRIVRSILNLTYNLIRSCFAGNPNDKKLSPRRNSAGKLERRNSLRGSSASRRLATIQRSGSMRHISNKNKTDDLESSTSNRLLFFKIVGFSLPRYTIFDVHITIVFVYREVSGHLLETVRQPQIDFQVTKIER